MRLRSKGAHKPVSYTHLYDLETGQAVWQCLIPNEKARQVQALLSEYDIFVEYYDCLLYTSRCV